MRKNLSLLTFLMMFCSFVFGQNLHWNTNEYLYNGSMTMTAVIQIDDTELESTSYEVAAFCNDELRGNAMLVNQFNRYYVYLTIYGQGGNNLTFKLYDHNKKVVLPLMSEECRFVENARYGSLGEPYVINFTSFAAQIGSTNYPTLEAAVEAVQAGETITVLKDIALDETLTIASEKNFTLNLNGNDITADLNIYGNLIVTGEGEFNANVVLAKETATLAAVRGLNVTTTVDAYCVVYENGMYKLAEIDYVAQIGTTKYETLAAAVAAAKDGETIELLWKDGDAPIAMNASLFGKNVTITGTATVDWSKGNLFVGRGGVGNATLTFDNANLTSASNNASTGIHVSGREKNTNNKYDGTVIIKNSTIELDYLINKGAMTLDNSTFTVKNGFSVGGRPASETENGVDATATIALTNGSKLVVNNHNGMGLGYETIGVMDIDGTSSFETTQKFLVTAKGTMNIAGTAKIAGDLTNNGTITLTAKAATLEAQEGLNIVTNIADYKVVYENGMYKVVAKVYVAQVGTTKYETLAAAFAAAKDGETIEMLSDATEEFAINNTANVTFDMNGFTLTGAIKPSTANLTVDNGTINNNNVAYSAIEINNGSLTIGNVKVNSVRHALRIDGAVTAIINGGTYKSALGSGTGTYHAANISGNATVTINGGEFVGPKGTSADSGSAVNVQAGANVAISGGNFSGGKTKTLASKGTLTLTGGTYDQDVTAFCAPGYEAKKQGDGTYVVRRKPAGYVSNRAKVTDRDDREAITVILKEVYALESLVVKVYNDETLMFTSTRREQDLDDEQKMLFPVDGNTSVNIVLWGQIAGSWINEIHVAPTELNVPNKIEVYADDTLVDTYTHQSGTVLGDYLDEYLALDCVKKAVAKIGETKYMTLAEAVAAAQAGETIIVLANVETTNVALPIDVTLDLNGKTVKADIIGKINTNGGLWTTPQGYKMIGKNADYYATEAATIVMGANYSLEMISGTVNLVPAQWYTLDGQNITIKQGATFNISAGQTFVINGSTVENNGTVNNAGTVQILAGTVKGNITGNLHFKGGNYITADNHNMVGTTSDYHYNATDALVNIATNGDITIAAGAMTLGHDWRTLPGQTVTVAEGAAFTVPTGMKYQIYGTAIVDGTITVNGTVELATLTATLKAQEGLNVITNIEDKAVAYENGTYKVVQAIYEQVQTLAQGWNWFSSYINIDGEEGLEMIQDELATSGIIIKNGNYYVEYSANYDFWFGNLDAVYATEMYMIKTSADKQIQLSGRLTDPKTEITLKKNSWSWIGYPIAHSMDLNAALKDLEAKHGDIIKSNNNGYAVYYESNAGSGWYGDLNALVPGQGYMYHSGNTEKDITLVYSTNNTRGELKDNVTAKDNYWTPRSSAFANNMTITAVLNVDGVEMGDNCEVAAFANGEVRGSARPIYVEAIDRYVLFLTVHGEGNEELTFKYIDMDTYEVYNLSNVVAYSNDAIVGTLGEPMILSCNTMGVGENGYSTMSLYPNPTTTNAAINFASVCDVVEVFNSLGVKVAEYRNVDSIDGIETAGVYVIRVTNDSTVQNCRLVVK